jgi:cysteinyl-tRNA synthetase
MEGLVQDIYIYDSLKREKRIFQPLVEGSIGMYVCGPTVYSDVHLGNIRTFISFDVMYRFFLAMGYRVRYVRNITDVGHLVGDVDEGAEDKIAKRARLEQLEPMEVVQKYMNGFHSMMKTFNVLPPSIEPRATGHILEQIEMVQQIIDNGYGYEKNGSVYFNVPKFVADFKSYGQLSGRVLEDLLSETREDLKNQGEKLHPSDFAIWIKADPSHLMRWNSPWSVGFPGWHLECSAMSTKYLGPQFDIHGGGADLKFPHHENEIAQNMGACKKSPANYWIHTNMLLLNGKKMAKSDGNSIMPQELFDGNSPHISKAYSPMTVRFFMLQAHYGGTLDITDLGLQGAEKAYQKLMAFSKALEQYTVEGGEDHNGQQALQWVSSAFLEMCDDFNTPKALAKIFELLSWINKCKSEQGVLQGFSAASLAELKTGVHTLLHSVFGLNNEFDQAGTSADLEEGLMSLILEIRKSSRENKDFSTADKIRDTLQRLGVSILDGKDGSSWKKN